MNLIERICKCGCEKTFKCLETSGQLYLSKLHIYAESRKESDSHAAKTRRGVTYQEEWEYKRITQPKAKPNTDDSLNLNNNDLLLQ